MWINRPVTSHAQRSWQTSCSRHPVLTANIAASARWRGSLEKSLSCSSHDKGYCLFWHPLSDSRLSLGGACLSHGSPCSFRHTRAARLRTALAVPIALLMDFGAFPRRSRSSTNGFKVPSWTCSRGSSPIYTNNWSRCIAIVSTDDECAISSRYRSAAASKV